MERPGAWLNGRGIAVRGGLYAPPGSGEEGPVGPGPARPLLALEARREAHECPPTDGDGEPGEWMYRAHTT